MCDRQDREPACRRDLADKLVDVWPTDRTTPAIDIARLWHAVGLPAIAMDRTGKRPKHAWQHLHDGPEPFGELEARFADHPHAVAVAPGPYAGLLVLDLDTEEGLAWARKQLTAGTLPRTPLQQVTHRGRHLFYRTPVGWDETRDGRLWFPGRNGLVLDGAGAPLGDVKASGNYVVAGGSRHRRGTIYRTLVRGDLVAQGDRVATLRRAVDALPHLPLEALDGIRVGTTLNPWRPRDTDRPRGIDASLANLVRGAGGSSEALRRAHRYAEAVPGAVSGAGGNPATFALASALVNGFALPAADALDVLRSWNRSCSPPWSDRDLERKVRDAERKGPPSGKPLGWLLVREQTDDGTRLHRHGGLEASTAEPASAAPEASRWRVQLERHTYPYDARLAARRAVRDGWHRDLTVSELRRGARLRACGRAMREEVCPDHGPVALGRHVCEHGACPHCGRIRAEAIARELEHEHSPVRWPARAAVLIVRSTPRGRASRRQHEQRRHRLGRNADDLARIEAIDHARREASRAVRRAQRRNGEPVPYRWVVGTDHALLVVPEDRLAVLDDALADLAEYDPTAQVLERRDLVGLVAAAWAEPSEMLARAIADDPLDVPAHPLLTDALVHRVRTGASKAGREVFPWATGDRIREVAREAADKARGGVPAGRCPHRDTPEAEPCGHATCSTYYDQLTGELLLTDDGRSPWGVSGELVHVLDMVLDDQLAGRGAPPAPPPRRRTVGGAQR